MMLTGIIIVVLGASILGAVWYAVWQIDVVAAEAEMQRARVALATEYDPANAEERLASTLANSYQLNGAHIGAAVDVQTGEITVPVPGAPERLLIWTPQRFGSDLFFQLAPMRVATSAAFLLCIMLLMRRLYLVARELEQRRREAQALAIRDPLTGLGNRLAFDQTMTRALARGDQVALFYLDLDGFKQVNDTFGHGAGDEVLRVVGERLGRLAGGDSDVVARIGGDEFAVVRSGATGREALCDYARRIEAVLAEPIMLGTNPLQIGASMGIATAPADGRTAGELMQVADIALYRAKRDRAGFMVAAA